MSVLNEFKGALDNMDSSQLLKLAHTMEASAMNEDNRQHALSKHAGVMDLLKRAPKKRPGIMSKMFRKGPPKVGVTNPDPVESQHAGKVFGYRTKQILPIMAAVAAIEGASEVAANSGDIVHGLKKEKYYQNMMDTMPELGDPEAIDQKRVKQTFDTLMKFNPDFASDPLVAASFVKQIAPRVDTGVVHDVVSRIVGARKDKPNAGRAALKALTPGTVKDISSLSGRYEPDVADQERALLGL